MSEANRQKIKFDRAGEAAIEAKDRFSAFAREHPLTTVAGGLALGILISGLFPRSPTRRLGRKTVGLAAVGAEAAMAYMHKALDAAGEASRSGAHRLDDWSEVIGDAARRVTREAAHLAENAGQSAGAAARETGERVSRHLPRRR